MTDEQFIVAGPGLLRVALLIQEAAAHRSDKDWSMFHLAVSEAAELAARTIKEVS